MDTTLQLFHSKKDEIEEFKKVDLKLLKYVSKSVFEVMTEMEFPPYSSKDSSKAKHFHVNVESECLNEILKDNIDIAKKFRFWVDLSRLRYNSTFYAVFELWGKNNTKHGDQLKSRLSELKIFTGNIQIGTGGKSGAGYQHIYSISIPIGDFTNECFEIQLKNSLKEYFFNHENKFIETAILELKEIIKKE